MRSFFRGSCHCGALGVGLETERDPAELPIRACQCSFCARRAARTATDPDGHARFIVRDPRAWTAYRFETFTAEFVLCGTCGVYLGAIGEFDLQLRATVEVGAFADPRLARPGTPVSYDDESAGERMARRALRWTPADVLECTPAPADSDEARSLLDGYFQELEHLLGEFDPQRSVSADAAELTSPRGAFLIVRENRVPVACGAVKTHAPGVGEIKRMYVTRDARGRGIGRDLLHDLERMARGLGHRRLVLDTAAPLERATALYLAAGYVEIPPYNDNPYAARWFEKTL